MPVPGHIEMREDVNKNLNRDYEISAISMKAAGNIHNQNTFKPLNA
jgi:hypothetical protein